MKHAQSGRAGVDSASRVTLRDIAAATGFTVNTVSHALKGKTDISSRTRRFIEETARGMGYIPDLLAASLRLGRSRTISAIIPDISDPMFAILVRDMESRLKEKDFDLFIQNTDEDDGRERRAIMAAIGKKVDGIIICPCQKDPENLELMRANGVPFVLLARRQPGNGSSYVIADDARGGYLATRHLLRRGHRDILFLNAPVFISSARERLQGYRRALREASVRFRPGLVREVRIRGGECSRVLARLLDEGVRFSAIFCFSDLMAWEAISFLQGRGIRVPDDVAVLGFDDIQSDLFYPYPLTSVGYSKAEMATAAVDTLMAAIETPTSAARHRIAVKVALELRGSA